MSDTFNECMNTSVHGESPPLKLYVDASTPLPESMEGHGWTVITSATEALMLMQQVGLDKVHSIMIGNGFPEGSPDGRDIAAFIEDQVRLTKKTPPQWYIHPHESWDMLTEVNARLTKLTMEFPRY